MNPLNINHIKLEKANAIKLRCNKLRTITKFFRVFEVFLVFAVISRLSFQLPLAIFKISNECIHSLSIFLVSPQFIFIVGNAIVITLFVNSGKLNNTGCYMNTPKTSVYGKKNKRMEQKYVKKHETTEENPIMAMIFSTPEHQVIKIYQRSKSENLRREQLEKNCCGLRRSKTEIKRLKDGSGCCKEAKGSHHYPEDHMSNEEFQKKIENFIARQQRFLREEEFSALEE